MVIDKNSLDYGKILHLFFHAYGLTHNDHPEEYIEGQWKRKHKPRYI